MKDAQKDIDSRSVTSPDNIDHIGKRAESENTTLPSDPDELYVEVVRALKKRYEQQPLDKRMDQPSRRKKFWTKWKKKLKPKKSGGQSGGQEQQQGEGSESSSGEEEGGGATQTGGGEEGEVIDAPAVPPWEEAVFQSTPDQPYQFKYQGDSDDSNLNLQIVPGDPNAGAAREEQERKGDPSPLRALFDKVKDKTKAGSLPDPVTLSVAKEGLYATTEFYGCTVIVVFNGHDFLLGHFCEEVPDVLDKSEGKGKGKEGEASEDALQKILKKGGKVLSDMGLINSEITVPLTNKMEQLDINDNTQVWLIHSAMYSRTSEGIQKLVEDLVAMDVKKERIGLIEYFGSGSVGTTRRGPSGKCVIEWVPKADKQSATFRLFADREERIWERDFDCNGEPVGDARAIGGNVVKAPE